MTIRWISKGATRRMIVRLVAFFAIATTSTIGVAWGIAGVRKIRSLDLVYLMYRGQEKPLVWYVQENGEPQYVEGVKFGVIQSPGSLDLTATKLHGRTQSIANLYTAEAPPVWSQCQRTLLPDDDDRSANFWFESLTGWPFLAMKQIRYWNYPNPIVVEEGWIIEQTTSKTYPYGTVRSLPLQPMWQGFILDVMIHGLAWWGVWTLGGVSRNRFRRWRGVCPKCRYDLRHEFDAGCPECGWRRGEVGGGEAVSDQRSAFSQDL